MFRKLLVVEFIILIFFIFANIYLFYNILNEYAVIGYSKEKLFKGSTDNLLNYIIDQPTTITKHDFGYQKNLYLNNTFSITCSTDNFNNFTTFCVKLNHSNNQVIIKTYTFNNFFYLIDIFIYDNQIFLIYANGIVKLNAENLTIINALAINERIMNYFQNKKAFSILNYKGYLIEFNYNLIEQKRTHFNIKTKNYVNSFILSNNSLVVLNNYDNYVELSLYNNTGIFLKNKILAISKLSPISLEIIKNHEDEITIFYPQVKKTKINFFNLNSSEIKMIKINGTSLELIKKDLITEIGYYIGIDYNIIISDVIIDEYQNYILTLIYKSNSNIVKSLQTNSIKGYWRDALIILKVTSEGCFIGSKIFESNIFEKVKYEYDIPNNSLYFDTKSLNIINTYTTISDIEDTYNNKENIDIAFYTIKTDYTWNNNFYTIDNKKIKHLQYYFYSLRLTSCLILFTFLLTKINNKSKT